MKTKFSYEYFFVGNKKGHFSCTVYTPRRAYVESFPVLGPRLTKIRRLVRTRSTRTEVPPYLNRLSPADPLHKAHVCWGKRQGGGSAMSFFSFGYFRKGQSKAKQVHGVSRNILIGVTPCRLCERFLSSSYK